MGAKLPSLTRWFFWTKTHYILDKNIKRNIYRLTKAAALVSIRVSSYEDIINAQKQCDFREAEFGAGSTSAELKAMPINVWAGYRGNIRWLRSRRGWEWDHNAEDRKGTFYVEILAVIIITFSACRDAVYVAGILGQLPNILLRIAVRIKQPFHQHLTF